MAPGGGGIRLDLRPIASLLPHEETIPEQLEKMALQIKRDGVQKDPLIIDKNSGAVLDGMHRLAAFSKLGFENIVCYAVDYGDPGIELRRWARVYRTAQTKLLTQALAELGLDRPSTLSEVFDLLDSRKCGIASLTQDGCRISSSPVSILEAFDKVESLDRVCKSLGWQRSFAREDEVDIALQDSQSVILLVQRLLKQDVLNAARSGRLFPCKTSMHTIDPRPVAMDFPIDELNARNSNLLAAMMEKRSPRTLPPNSLYEGRRYKERLIVLDPH